MLLVGWAGAFRREELVAITVEAITWCPEGVRIKLPRSKTDQRGQGRTKAIPKGTSLEACPVQALKAWLEASGIRAGYVFLHVDRWGHLRQKLTDHAVAVIWKEYAGAAGLDEAQVSGHSARAGLVTEATRKKRPLHKIMAQTGHVKVDTVLGYARDEEAFEENAAEGLL
jgi:integrase